jgi:hypothetical protein
MSMNKRPFLEVDTSSGPSQGPLATMTMTAGQPTKNLPSLQASQEGLYRLRRRAHDDRPRPLGGSKVSDGGIFRLALCAVLGAIILLSLRRSTDMGRAPRISDLALVALEDVDPRASPGFAGTSFWRGDRAMDSRVCTTHDRSSTSSRRACRDILVAQRA